VRRGALRPNNGPRHEDGFTHGRLHVVDNAVKDQNYRTGQDRPCEQDPHIIRRGKKFPEGSDVGLESLRVRVDVFFQLGEAQGPPDVAVRNIGLSQDDIILGRAPKECVLGVDHEPPTTIDCLKI